MMYIIMFFDIFFYHDASTVEMKTSTMKAMASADLQVYCAQLETKLDDMCLDLLLCSGINSTLVSCKNRDTYVHGQTDT